VFGEELLEENTKNSVCFIVLNFNSGDLTESCVDSIMALDVPKEKDVPVILIVDNASNDNSGDLLKSKYENSRNVHVIINDKNEGFSAGNNIGYLYAKEHFEVDFIVATNSDVQFVQKDFITILYQLYKRHSFWVAGPDIVVKDRYYHQNPRMIVEGYPKKEQIEELKRKWACTEMHMKRHDLFSMKKYIRERYRSSIILKFYYRIKNKFRGDRIYLNEREDVSLQGSCIIFDKRYIANSSWLFNPITFLYLEEQVLSLDCYLNKRNTVYFPQLKVSHLDCGSTYNAKMSFSMFCEKKANQMRRGIESANVYLKYLDDRLG